MQNTANILLRLSVSFAFLYAAVDSFAQPLDWIDYIPQFFVQIAPAIALLRAFGGLEILLALWILSGYKIVIPSVLSALILITIVSFNLEQFQLLFRDVSIAAAALALAIQSYCSTPSGSFAGQR